MKDKFRIGYLGLLLLSSWNLLAVSGAPVIDPVMIAETIRNSAKQTIQFIKQYNQIAEQMATQMLTTDLTLKNQQHIAANQVVRGSEIAHRLENARIRRDSQPATSACDAHFVTQEMSKNTCDFIGRADDIMDKTAHVFLGGDSSKSYHENTKAVLSEVLRTQAVLAKSLDDESAGINANLLLNPLPQGYSADEAKAADLSRRLILDPLPPQPIKSLPKDAKKVSMAAAVEQVNQYSHVARKLVAAESLAIIQAENTIPEGEQFSKVGLMNQFVADRFLNDDWVKKVTNTHEDKAKDEKMSTHPAVLLREIALLEAFSAYMDVEGYKSMQRQNALLATHLAVVLDEKKTM